MQDFPQAARTPLWLVRLGRWMGLSPRTLQEPPRRRLLPTVSDGGGDAASLRAQCDGFHGTVMAQLEQGFDQFVRGRIALETYRLTVEAQREAALERIAQLLGARVGGRIGQDVFAREAADAEAALAAAEWCLRWTDEQLSASASEE